MYFRFAEREQNQELKKRRQLLFIIHCSLFISSDARGASLQSEILNFEILKLRLRRITFALLYFLTFTLKNFSLKKSPTNHNGQQATLTIFLSTCWSLISQEP